MKKLGFSIVLIMLVVLFTVFNMGDEIGLGYGGPAEIEDEKEPIEEIVEPEPEEVITEPEIMEEPENLTRADVLNLIENSRKVMVQNPDDILVLVNKERNLEASYVPQDLVIPDIPFSFDGYDQKKNMREEAARAIEELLTQAHAEGHMIYGVSGYRSYERQETIFIGNALRDGFKKANTYSAIPGQSEHQTGLAMDLSSPSVNFRLVTRFGETPEGIWLKENCHLYGFIIRFPQDKTHITGYQYEPWHIRYVGIEDATEIMLNDLTLEEYLHNKE
ncbi:MAG: M15 family metallopeptidase [Clostridia bacterium]|nr:M15 family metallopeptidase [Clostridia bacterium]